jgi:hypothetical protein
MFKYKQLIAGIIIGAVMVSMAPVSAAIEEFICYKADYKLVINGIEYNDPDLPLMSYKGYTVGSVRKILEAVGVPITWNAELGQVEVNTATLQTTNESEVMTMTETLTEQLTQTPDGITQFDIWEGKQYIGYIYIRNKIQEKGYAFEKDIKSDSWQIIKGDQVILGNIPTIKPFGYSSVEVNYYINTILPLIK